MKTHGKFTFLRQGMEKHVEMSIMRNRQSISLQFSLNFSIFRQIDEENFHNFQSPSRFSPLKSSCRIFSRSYFQTFHSTFQKMKFYSRFALLQFL